MKIVHESSIQARKKALLVGDKIAAFSSSTCAEKVHFKIKFLPAIFCNIPDRIPKYPNWQVLKEFKFTKHSATWKMEDNQGFSLSTNHSAANGNGTNEGGFKRSRKRKSGFFARAKKFGKQGKLGHGYEIDTETYTYFLRVLELCQKNEFENDEEKDDFVENAFTQTENEEVNLSSNQLTSRVLEKLLAETNNPDILIRFTTQFTPSLRTLCTDPYASHVVEKLLHVISTKWTQSKVLSKWFRNTCQYVLNNYEEFIFNNFANRIMRKVCQCLSGTVELFLDSSLKNSSGSSSQYQNSTNKFVVPSIDDLKQLRTPKEDGSRKNHKRNTKILKSFAAQFISWPQFNDLFQDGLTSGFVQCLITTLVAVDEDLVSDGVLQVVEAIKGDIEIYLLPQLFTVEVCAAISADNDTIFRLIYMKYFQGKLPKLSVDGFGHFTLERLLNSILDRDLFEEMYDALEGHFEAIYDLKYLSVFTAISGACLRLKTKQAGFVEKIATLLNGLDSTGCKTENGDGEADKPKKKKRADAEEVKEEEEDKRQNFVEILCRFGKPVVMRQDGIPHCQTEFHGSSVLQNMLMFHKPFKVVSSMMELDGQQIKSLAKDPKGSHVIDSFLKSPEISEKYKDQLILKLKEHLVSLASSKFGARVLDNYWAIATIKNKGLIAAALSPRESQLNADPYGKFLSTKCGLSLYKRNVKQWTEIMNPSATTKKKRKKFAEDVMTNLGLDPSKLSSKKSKIVDT